MKGPDYPLQFILLIYFLVLGKHVRQFRKSKIKFISQLDGGIDMKGYLLYTVAEMEGGN